MKEKLLKKMEESKANLNAVLARISKYDEERNKEVQEALRIDGEIRLLSKMLKEEK